MSYTVLARKWRPQHFADMVGQEHVLQALINALTQNRLHHAYLFTGTRGVGKTSVARLLAKALSCEQGITATPCRKCSACLEIEQGRSVDLIEVDAASRTKVEDTRELLDNVQYAPTRNRFKIYLIDEVHMLSSHSFNALLKTLEEPPEHVKFLLATTDPQKLPITVLSRCLQFNLKNLLPEQIESHLGHVLDQEQGITYDANALRPVSLAANGSMRDGLSLLDQLIAYSNGDITAESARKMLGNIDNQHIIDILHAIAQQDAATALASIRTLAIQGADFQHVLEALIIHLHQLAVYHALPDAIDTVAEQPEAIAKLADTISPEDTQLYYQIALNGRRDLPLVPNASQGVEMVLLRMLAFQPAARVNQPPSSTRNIQTTASAPKTLAAKKPTPPPKSNAEATTPAAVPVPPTAPAQPPTNSAAQAPAPLAAPTKPPAIPLAELSNDNWNQVHSSLALKGMTKMLASHCAITSVEEHRIQVTLKSAHKAMLNHEQQQRIEQALTDYFQQNVRIDVTIADSAFKTPADQADVVKAQKQANAEQSIESDPKVQMIVDRFDGKVLKNSITATQ